MISWTYWIKYNRLLQLILPASFTFKNVPLENFVWWMRLMFVAELDHRHDSGLGERDPGSKC